MSTSVFQFYYSAIKTKMLGLVFEGKTHFNSTIVRLKLNTLGDDYYNYFNFNSTIVRLKQARGNNV